MSSGVVDARKGLLAKENYYPGRLVVVWNSVAFDRSKQWPNNSKSLASRTHFFFCHSEMSQLELNKKLNFPDLSRFRNISDEKGTTCDSNRQHYFSCCFSPFLLTSSFIAFSPSPYIPSFSLFYCVSINFNSTGSDVTQRTLYLPTFGSFEKKNYRWWC